MKEKLCGMAVLYAFIGLWTPVIWFVSSARQRHHMEMFSFWSLSWFEMASFIILSGVALLSTYGLILVAEDASKVPTE